MAKQRRNIASPKKIIDSVAESGAIKKNWQGRKTVALVYPNTYHVGMSNLGFQTVYSQFNGFDGVVCERVFLPATESQNGKPPYSLESNRKLSDFDVIAFSISFENDYPNILTLLAKADLTLFSDHRNDKSPLVMAGGVTCFLNPEPIAPFIDAFLIGESEGIIPALVQWITNDLRPDIPRKDRLLKLAQTVPGVYVPLFYEPQYHHDGTLSHFIPSKDVPPKIKALHPLDLSSDNCFSTILTTDTTFDNTFLIEVSRGCAHGCRFCSAGFIYRPPRFRTRKHLEKNILTGKARTHRIGLVGAAVSDLPDIDRLCADSSTKGLQIGFSSLRADALSATLMRALKNSGVKTATIAPDAGSKRLRTVINKGLSEESILAAVHTLVDYDIPNIKLYFMIGLPTETNDDIHAISALCKKIKHTFLTSSRHKGKMGAITVSLNCFVPKPFTPFQWVAMDDIKSLKNKIKQIKQNLGKIANLRVHADIPRWAFIQAILSRGDRRVAQLLLTAHENGGNWAQALKTAPINPLFYAQRERNENEFFPWDFIDHGIDKAFLWKEFKRALAEKPSPACPMEPQRCRLCGVCK
jgi:radical SAM family uncharacterized protein